MGLHGSSRWQSSEHSGAPGELTGMLLVASPSLADPNFARTVVLVLDHGPSGTIGLVLNRPTGVPVDEILRQWHEQAALASPAVIFSGGPVSPSAVIGLVRGTLMGEPAGWRSVLGEVGTVDLSVPPEDQPALDGARLFSGYSGWASDQLDDEIDEGAWFCLDAIEDDLMTREPEQLWHDVLRRQGGDLGMLANFPPHPSVN
jgi:putative transcriptional regulator